MVRNSKGAGIMRKIAMVLLLAGLVLVVVLMAGPSLRYALEYIDMRIAPWSHSFSIKDVARPETVILSNPKDNVFDMKLRVRGNLDGSASITLYGSRNGAFSQNLKSGRIATIICSDYYPDGCRIEYMPVDVKKGNLEIDYLFLSPRQKSS